MPVEAAEFRTAVGSFATGVTLVTVRDGRDDIGSTVTAFTSLSLDPPMVGVAIAEESYLVEALSRAGSFAVTMLAEGQKALAGRFTAAGRPSARILLANVAHHRGAESEAMIVDDGCAAVECVVADQVAAGDHVLFLCTVTAVDYVDAAARPLLHQGGSYSS